MYKSLSEVPVWVKEAYDRGHYTMAVPAVTTGGWSTLAWINHIGESGFAGYRKHALSVPIHVHAVSADGVTVAKRALLSDLTGDDEDAYLNAWSVLTRGDTRAIIGGGAAPEVTVVLVP